MGAGFSLAPSTGVTVTGIGSIRVEPDIAIVAVGAKATASDVRVAVDRANGAAGAARDAMLAAGVEARDVTVGRAATWSDGRRGSTASLSLRAVVRNVASTGGVLQAALNAAGEYADLDSVQFEVEDRAPHEVAAREKAYADARAKAEQYAALARRRLGAVVEVVDDSDRVVYRGASAGGIMPMMTRGKSVSEPVVAAPGTVDIDVRVRVRWELMD